MDSSWKNVFILLAVCAVIFTLLTIIEIYVEKKIRAYYLKKSRQLEAEEHELLNRLNAKETQGK